MTDSYKPLAFSLIARGCPIKNEPYTRKTRVPLDAPASQVMTDLSIITPFAIEPTATIEAANRKMIACGVRLLFVTESDNSLVGLITATDVLGEKPVQYIHAHGGSRDDILVRHIMTPSDKLEAVRLLDVENATVGDMIETMKAFKRQHLLVVERCDASEAGECICGLFSTTQIARQTGVDITPSQRPTSFADIEKAVSSS